MPELLHQQLQSQEKGEPGQQPNIPAGERNQGGGEPGHRARAVLEYNEEQKRPRMIGDC